MTCNVFSGTLNPTQSQSIKSYCLLTSCLYSCRILLLYFDAVGWVAGRISGLWKLTDGVLAWLSVWSEVQMICIWFSWCHCHPVVACFIKIQIGLTVLVLVHPGCPGKEAVKPVSVCLLLTFYGHGTEQPVLPVHHGDKRNCRWWDSVLESVTLLSGMLQSDHWDWNVWWWKASFTFKLLRRLR